MYSSPTSKAVTIIGSLSIATGILLIVCRGFHLQVFQTLTSYISFRLNTALVFIVFGSALLFIQYKIKRRSVMELNGQLEDGVDIKPVKTPDLLEKLKKCEGNYHALIEQVSDAVSVLDFKGAIIEVNASMCKMTGYSREELLKLNIAKLIDPEQLKTDPVIQYLQNPVEPLSCEKRLVRKNGQVFEAEVNAKMFEDNRLMLTARDITRRKQMETELREAELKFHTLAEKSITGVYIIQKEKLLYINARFAEVFGYETYELVNSPDNFIDLIITEDCRAIVRKNIQARYRGDIDFINYEVSGRKKDGTINHIEFSGSRAVINAEPTIIGTMIDITERWKTETVLKQYEANLQTILNTTDTAYALFDKDLILTSLNQMASKFVQSQYGFQPQVGYKLKDYFPPARLPEFMDLVVEVLKGNNTSYEISYPQPDGSVCWYYVRLFPICNKQKEIFGLMLALSDITKRKNSEDSLHAAYKKIHDHINSIKDMAWKQSHLIRSPLANLKGLVAMLQDNPADEEILGYINIELERLDKVIIDMAEDASNHDM
jgi:PAS domain S-box-containing protein